MARALVSTVDSVEQEDVRFILVEGSRRILPELNEELSGYGLEQLRERGIDVRLNTFLNSCVDGTSYCPTAPSSTPTPSCGPPASRPPPSWASPTCPSRRAARDHAAHAPGGA